MWQTYVKPMMSFSVGQEEVVAAERQRGDGLLALIDDFNAQSKKHRWRLPWSK